MWPFSKPKVKKKWRLCKTIEHEYPMHLIKVGGTGISPLFYHLFEAEDGERIILAKINCLKYSQSKLDNYAANTSFYNLVLFPWVCGRNSPDIPRYEDIPGEETMLYLTGLKSPRFTGR